MLSTRPFCRRSIFLPFVESYLQQDRFQGKTKDATEGIYLIPSSNEKRMSEK